MKDIICGDLRDILIKVSGTETGGVEHIYLLIVMLSELKCFSELDRFMYPVLGMFG